MNTIICCYYFLAGIYLLELNCEICGGESIFADRAAPELNCAAAEREEVNYFELDCFLS